MFYYKLTACWSENASVWARMHVHVHALTDERTSRKRNALGSICTIVVRIIINVLIIINSKCITVFLKESQ